MEKEFDQNLNTEMQEPVISAPEVAAETETDTQVVSADINSDVKPEIVETPKEIIAAEVKTKPAAQVRSNKRILQGKVVSNKADKTISVAIVSQVAHPLYKKYFKRTKKVMAHDEQNSCNIGDTVKVRESRPLSRQKRWELIDIVERAK
jgi:small subunit ribosomal protein S17